MEANQLQESLTQVLTVHNAPNVRYQGLGLSANAPEYLRLIIETLHILLPQHTLW